MRKLAIVIALFLWVAPAGAYTVEEWIADLYSDSPVAREGAEMFFCGALQGVQASELHYMRKRQPGYELYCGAKGSMKQRRDEFLLYLDETRRGWDGASLYVSSAVFSFHREKSSCGGPSY